MRSESLLNADDDAPRIGTFRYEEAGSATVPLNLAGLSDHSAGRQHLSHKVGLWRPASRGLETVVDRPVGTVISNEPELGVLRFQPGLYAGTPLQEYRARRRRNDSMGRILLGVLGIAVVLPVGYLVLSGHSSAHRASRPTVSQPVQVGGSARLAPVAPAVYVVQSGDILGRIAERQHVRLEALLAANHLDAKATLRIGERLAIPAAPTSNPAQTTAAAVPPVAAGAAPVAVGPVASAARAGVLPASVNPVGGLPAPAAPVVLTRHYVVPAGVHDPAIVAHRFGLSTNTLLAANHLMPGDRVRSGRRLLVPPADGYYHTVVTGDSIARFLKRRHIDLATFARYNPGVTVLHHREVVFLPGDPPVIERPRHSRAKFRGYRPRSKFVRGHRGLFGALGRALDSVFRWPLADHDITSPFGPRGKEFHQGIDIGAPMGTPIDAAKGGVVIRAGWESGYGESIDISDGGGVMTRYAHASKLLVHDGERVHAGQEIGRVGMTGDATGPHLHFEVRIHGRPINPMKVL